MTTPDQTLHNLAMKQCLIRHTQDNVKNIVNMICAFEFKSGKPSKHSERSKYLEMRDSNQVSYIDNTVKSTTANCRVKT